MRAVVLSLVILGAVPAAAGQPVLLQIGPCYVVQLDAVHQAGPSAYTVEGQYVNACAASHWLPASPGPVRGTVTLAGDVAILHLFRASLLGEVEDLLVFHAGPGIWATVRGAARILP